MWGKVFGAMLGAAIGMVLAWSPGVAAALALVGLLLGHFAVDREPAAPRLDRAPTAEELLARPSSPERVRPARQPTLEQQTLAEILCPVFIEVARCDGPVVQAEVRGVREFFQRELGFDDAGSEGVRAALKSALASPPGDVEQLVKRARAEIKPSLRLAVVRAMYDIGLSDGALARSEVDVLKLVATHFNLAEEQLQQITTTYFGRGEAHLRALGLAHDASDEDVRAAFRRLAAEHHPDRAASLGPVAVERSAEKFRAVKEAYEELRKIRGF